MRSSTSFKVLLLSVLLFPVPHLRAGEEVNKFRIRIGHGAGTGSEEYRIERTASGFRLTGTTRLTQMGREVEMTQEQLLGADLSLERYRLEATTGDTKQTIEAWKDGQQIRMRTSMGDQGKNESTPLRPHTLVLDNVIVSHFQILLNAAATTPKDGAEWWCLVPQRLLSLKGRITEGTIESGTLEGKKIQARKYTLEIANLIEEFWAEPETNRLLRVFVPMQNVEIVREGFVLAPHAADTKRPNACIESQVTFSSGSLQIPGTLCLPAGSSGRVPVVVLVHGSGPNDRDETIGPNKPFRDLAQGLGASGIATLRYDKRTFAFKQQIDVKTITLDQEVTDDAVAGLNYSLTRPEIDPGKIFVLGHSLGGMMVPFISKRFHHLCGAVMMAAAARPLDELICEQTAFQSRVAGIADAGVEKRIQELKSAFARIRSGAASDDEMVMFAPARYWREQFQLDIPKAVADVKVPVLVLQGGKDVQVTKTDYDLIRKALPASAVERTEVHWFPNLNHLFMEVTGEATGAEYGREGTVSNEIIETISAWIKRQ